MTSVGDSSVQVPRDLLLLPLGSLLVGLYLLADLLRLAEERLGAESQSGDHRGYCGYELRGGAGVGQVRVGRHHDGCDPHPPCGRLVEHHAGDALDHAALHQGEFGFLDHLVAAGANPAHDGHVVLRHPGRSLQAYDVAAASVVQVRQDGLDYLVAVLGLRRILRQADDQIPPGLGGVLPPVESHGRIRHPAVDQAVRRHGGRR